MAAKKEVDSLTIQMDGKEHENVPLASFSLFVRGTVLQLRDLDPEKTLIWRVKDASMNSPFSMTTTADAASTHWNTEVVDNYLAVFRSVDGSEKPPRGVPSRVLRRASLMVAVLGDGVGSLTMSAPGRDPVVPRQPPRCTAEPIKSGYRWEYEDFSELEGTLEVASIHHGTKIFIYDALTGHKTSCIVSREMLNKALDAMKEDSPRVSVYGRTRYDKKGQPVEIVVEAFDRLPGFSEITDVIDVPGIDITGGIESAAYVRGLRDEV